MQLESAHDQAFLPGVSCAQPGLRWGTEPGFGVGTLPVGTGGGLGVTTTLPATRVTGGSNGADARGTPVVLRTISGSIVLLALLFGVAGDARHRRPAIGHVGVLADRGTAHGDRAGDRYLAVGRRHDCGRLLPPGTSGTGNTPKALQHRSDDGIGAVARAAQEAGSDPAVADAITTLSTDLPAYSGVIQEAGFNERDANYPWRRRTWEANNLMRTSMLPAAASCTAPRGNAWRTTRTTRDRCG